MHIPIRGLEQFLRKNGPTILTALGSLGVIATAVLSTKATIEASHRVYVAEQIEDRSFTKKEVIKMTWPLYIPTALMSAASIACIIGTHGIHARKQAALIGLYTMSEAAFREYRERIVDEIGESKERKMSEEAFERQMAKKPVTSSEVHVTGRGEALFFDEMSGRYFQSDMESVRKAVNDVNEFVINHGPVALNELYSKIGLTYTTLGDEVGWNSDRLLEVEFVGMIADDQRPCIALRYRVNPTYCKY